MTDRSRLDRGHTQSRRPGPRSLGSVSCLQNVYLEGVPTVILNFKMNKDVFEITNLIHWNSEDNPGDQNGKTLKWKMTPLQLPVAPRQLSALWPQWQKTWKQRSFDPRHLCLVQLHYARVQTFLNFPDTWRTSPCFSKGQQQNMGSSSTPSIQPSYLLDITSNKGSA